MRVPVGGLNFLPVVPKEGVPWFSDQLAQMWGRRGNGRRKDEKLPAVSHQNMSQTLMTHAFAM